VGLPILGVVENMSGFVCPKCQTKTEIFAPTTGGAEKMAADMQVPFLGRVPIDPLLARACDEGADYFRQHPTAPGAQALLRIIDGVKANLEKH